MGKIIKGKKGASLRSITMIMIFSIVVLIPFTQWVTTGQQEYDVSVDQEYAESFGTVNGTLNQMLTDSETFGEKVEKLSEPGIGTLYYLPSVIIDALKIPFTYLSNLWNIMTEFTKILGIPQWFWTAIKAAMLFLLGYLIIDAFLRHKNT